MQKFTRPLAREIEVAGQRLAVTLSEKGVSVRPVGARKPPWEMNWDQVIQHVTGAADVAGIAEQFKKGGPTPASPAPQSAATSSEQSSSAAEPAPAAERSFPAPKAAAATAKHSAADGSTADDLSAILGRLDQWFGSHRKRYHEGLQPGATASQLENLQGSLGMPLPSEIRTLLSWHNGQKADFVGHFQLDWDLMSTNQIAETKRELDSTAGGAGWQKNWVPIFQDDSDDYVVVDPAQPGAPVREFWQGKTDHPVVAPSLSAWLTKFVDDVEHGKYHEEAERGSFLPKNA